MRLLLALLPCLLPASALAAGGPFEAARAAIRSEAVEEGVPSPRVNAALRDRFGRLWVGTTEGAAYLGGPGWTPLPFPREASSHFVRAMAETSDGALWFGTEAGGLWRWRKGMWRRFGEGQGLPVARVNALLADGDAVWVGTGGGGLWRIQGEQSERAEAVLEPWIWTLASVPDKTRRPRVWAGGETQVWVQADAGWRRLGPEVGFWAEGANAIVARRGPGGAQEVWLSAWDAGVGRWDSATERFSGPLPDPPSRSPTCLTAVPVEDGEEELWMGTLDVGLARHTPRGWEPLGPAQGFPSAGVYALLANPSGRPRLWAGTKSAGIVSVDPNAWRSLADDPRLPSRQANTFLTTEEPGGGRVLWIGTDRGLVRWAGDGVKVRTTEDGLPSNFVTDIREFEGPAGKELWVGTIRGIARLKQGRWDTFGAAEGLHFRGVQTLAAERTAAGGLRVWAAGPSGLAQYEGDRWHPLAIADALPKNLNVSALHTVREADGSSTLWVAIRGSGVGRVKGGTFRLFGATEGLPNVSVYHLADSVSPDGKRWLWVTMAGGGGLARLDLDHPEKGFESRLVDAIPGFPGEFVQRIAVARNGSLYLTTSRGVAHLELQGPEAKPWRVLTYSTSDGLPSAASDVGAIHLDLDDHLWVGTAKGVAVLDVRRGAEGPAPPAPLIEQVVVDGRALDPEGPLRLGWRDRSLSVRFGLATLLRHEAILYRTQLIGLEDHPQAWSRKAEREFTTLPPRDYILRIWANDGLGHPSPPSDLRFTVPSAPWATWWAIALQALVAVGLVLGLVRTRQRTLERRAEQLEALVVERTRELAKANELLHEQSVTDPLTGLSNRRSLGESMAELTSRMRRRRSQDAARGQRDRDVAFLLLDLDHFKAINDTYGHHAGDRVLRDAGALLRQTVRDVDRVYRWGGEEFLVVAVDTDHAEIPVLAERLRGRFAQKAFDVGQAAPLRLSVSIGFTCIPMFDEDLARVSWEQAIQLADLCLYRAKQLGRNRWVGLLPRPGAQVPSAPLSAPTDLEALLAGGWVEQVSSGPAVPGT